MAGQGWFGHPTLHKRAGKLGWKRKGMKKRATATKMRKAKPKGQGWHGQPRRHARAAAEGWDNHCQKWVVGKPKRTARIIGLI